MRLTNILGGVFFAAMLLLTSRVGAQDLIDLPPELLDQIEKRLQERKDKKAEPNSKDKAAVGEEKPDEKQVTEQLDAFFKEMEAVLESKDEFSLTVKKLKANLKNEFRENEKQLSDAVKESMLAPAKLSELRERQKVIAQCYLNLKTRAPNSDPRQQMQVHRTIRDGFREFRKQNPKLARDKRLTEKEQELTNLAMQQRMGLFGGMGEEPSTVTETMRDLSSGDSDTAGILGNSTPKNSLAHPGEQEGAIQDMRDGVGALLQLKWEGRNLAIDRDHWDLKFAGMTVQDVQDEVDAMLESEGVEVENNRDQQRMMRRMGMYPGSSNAERLFQELRGSGHASGYSRGGSGDDVTMSFTSNACEVRMKLSDKRFELSIEEFAGPRRIMRIVETDDGLDLLLVGDMVHRFSARTNGDGLSMVEVLGDDVLKFKAKSFAEFYRDEPRFVESRFFALLDHLGIGRPASRFHPDVVTRLLEVISVDKSAMRVEVAKLVAALDADRFTQREAAYAQLKAGIDDYYELLYPMQEDEGMSTEVRARVRKLLNTSEASEASHFDGVISALGLADDVEYLAELQDNVNGDSRDLVEQRLRQLQDK